MKGGSEGRRDCFLFSLFFPTGPPVNVAMAIEVASIDHISEANMVMYKFTCRPLYKMVAIFHCYCTVAVKLNVKLPLMCHPHQPIGIQSEHASYERYPSFLP